MADDVFGRQEDEGAAKAARTAFKEVTALRFDGLKHLQRVEHDLAVQSTSPSLLSCEVVKDLWRLCRPWLRGVS